MPTERPLALVAAAVALSLPASASAVLCGPGINRSFELIGSSPGGDAWAVREVHTARELCGGEEEPKSPYPKIKDLPNFGTVLHLCRAAEARCQQFPVYEPVGCDEAAKTSPAEASKQLAAAKQACAAAKVDLTRPGIPLDEKGVLPAGGMKPHGIDAVATAKVDRLAAVVEAPGFEPVALVQGSQERVDGGFISAVPSLSISADGSLLFWTMVESLCEDQQGFEARPLRHVAAMLFEERGVHRYLKKAYAEAALDFAAAQALRPGEARLGLRLGLARLLAGQKDAAMADLEKALQSDPSAGLDVFP